MASPKFWPYRTIAIAWGLLSLFAAGLAEVELGYVGFPDSHITPYAAQTLGLRHVLVDACAVQGIIFLVLGLFRKSTRISRLCVGILIAAVVIVAPMIIVPACWSLPGCPRAYEFIMKAPMDDGAGG